jgi:hypothetical protein
VPFCVLVLPVSKLSPKKDARMKSIRLIPFAEETDVGKLSPAVLLKAQLAAEQPQRPQRG